MNLQFFFKYSIYLKKSLTFGTLSKVVTKSKLLLRHSVELSAKPN